MRFWLPDFSLSHFPDHLFYSHGVPPHSVRGLTGDPSVPIQFCLSGVTTQLLCKCLKSSPNLPLHFGTKALGLLACMTNMYPPAWFSVYTPKQLCLLILSDLMSPTWTTSESEVSSLPCTVWMHSVWDPRAPEGGTGRFLLCSHKGYVSPLQQQHLLLRLPVGRASRECSAFEGLHRGKPARDYFFPPTSEIQRFRFKASFKNHFCVQLCHEAARALSRFSLLLVARQSS